MAAVMLIVGAVLIVAGTALLSVEAAVAVLGVLLVLAAVDLRRPGGDV